MVGHHHAHASDIHTLPQSDGTTHASSAAPGYDDYLEDSKIDLEKKGEDHDAKVFVADPEDDEARMREVEELEARLKAGDATEEEYAVHDVSSSFKSINSNAVESLGARD